MDKEKLSKSQKIEAFFGEIEKIPHGDILRPILEKFTDKGSCEFSEDKELARVFGKSTSFDRLNPPIIEITFPNKENFSFLTIFRNENDFSRQENASACLLISGSGGEAKIESAIYKNRRDNANLLNPYERYLSQIDGYASLLIDESESKKNQ